MNLENICAKMKDIVIGKEKTLTIKSIEIGEEYTKKEPHAIASALGSSYTFFTEVQLRPVAVEVVEEGFCHTITAEEIVRGETNLMSNYLYRSEIEALRQLTEQQVIVRTRGYDSGLLRKIANTYGK